MAESVLNAVFSLSLIRSVIIPPLSLKAVLVQSEQPESVLSVSLVENIVKKSSLAAALFL